MNIVRNYWKRITGCEAFVNKIAAKLMEERMRSSDPANSHLKLSELPRYEKTENTFQKAFIALQCNCVLCATQLDLKVTTTVENGQIKEEAFCPQCNIRMRSKSHTLQ